MVFTDNHGYPVAGLDPATHVFFCDIAAVGRRGWPGQARPRGNFGGELGANGASTEHEKLNRTAVGQARARGFLLHRRCEDAETAPLEFPRTALRESGNPGAKGSSGCPGPPLSRG